MTLSGNYSVNFIYALVEAVLIPLLVDDPLWEQTKEM